MRYVITVLCTLLLSVSSALAQVSIGIGLPGGNIGVNLPVYPELVQVPGYPVYYAPQLDSNFFFYDGLYWVYERDNWYASSWYNGPWGPVAPEMVPLFVLRIPVRYYRDPPMYFRNWRPEGPPRWGDHWGHDWRQQRSGWDKWDRRSAPAPAPLPVYQRNYSGERYPQAEQQRNIHNQNYHYQPRDNLVRQHNEAPAVQRTPASTRQGPQEAPQERSQRPQDSQRTSVPPPIQQSTPQRAPAPTRQGPQEMPQERSQRPQDSQRTAVPPPIQQSTPVVPRAQTPQRGGEEVRRSVPVQAPARQSPPAVQEQMQSPRQGAPQHEQHEPTPRQDNNRNDRGASQEQGRSQGQGQEKEHESGEGRGQGRNR